ncbi:unnamed protein product [Urochloa decumbens]|uniref:Remorin C-terminal domain-containing protein n=1 Tax=Urochloa decumbens TaxID=240449 RepID=A0ABC8YE50_9POAL
MEEEARNTDTPGEEPAKDDVAEEKAPAPEESKALVVVESDEKPAATDGSRDRDAFLSRLATDKSLSLIRAWEESEKAKAENRAARRLANVTSWENSKVAQMEAELKKIHVSRMGKTDDMFHAFFFLCSLIFGSTDGWVCACVQEQLEMKKAARAEKLRNSAAAAHRAAEEKRAAAVAMRGEEVIRAEEAAARYRATGQAPTKLFGLGLFGRG